MNTNTGLQTVSDASSRFSRRRFMFLGGVALATVMELPSMLRAASVSAASASGTADMMPETDGVFQAAPLPYDYSALQPSIDTETMHLHHDKHYVGYTNNLNKALESAPELKTKSIEELLVSIKSLPEAVRKAIRNNGGGYYNHSLFWRMMTPNKDSKRLSPSLEAAIIATFGSMDKFKEAFIKEAGTVFGSGWAWLVYTPQGELKITSTPNQDSPVMADIAEVPGKPILALDVWEHAYYLKYKNVRADYMKAWWDIVNWETASELYKKAKG
ncbi:MAG: superoxide dismutase [Chthoniobacterales bacterium]